MTKRQQKLTDIAKNHPIRKEILKLNLKDTENIAQRLHISREDAKRHLTILKRCGLVTYGNSHKNRISDAVYNKNCTKNSFI